MSDSATCRDPAAISYIQRKCIEWAERGMLRKTVHRRLEPAGKVRYRRLLEALVAQGHTRPSIERCLGMPQRSLREPSRENYALVQMITAMPWLLRVAESGHDPAVARAEMMKAAAEAMAARTEGAR